MALAAAKGAKGTKRTWKYYAAFVVISLSLGIGAQIKQIQAPVLTLLVLLSVWAVAAKPFAARARKRWIRSVFAEERTALNDQELTLDETGISCDRTNGAATFHYRWDGFIQKIALPDAFLFLPSPNSFVRVPIDQLQSTELELVISWSAAVPMSAKTLDS